MKLRTQMLLAGALTLAVPVVGWQSVNQLDASLRLDRAEAQELRVANTRLALADTKALPKLLDVGETPQQAADIYAERSRYPLFVDGYADDWQNLGSRPIEISDPTGELAVWAATRHGRLHLHVQVTDDRVVYHQPPLVPSIVGEVDRPNPEDVLVNGDAIEVFFTSPADAQVTVAPQHWLLRAEAPGPIDARHVGTGRPTSVATAVWRAATGGYQVELDLPLPVQGAIFGVAAIDVDSQGAERDRWIGTLAPDRMRSLYSDPDQLHQTASTTSAARLYHVSDVVSKTLARWITPGVRARLFDRQGRLLADVNELYADLEDDLADDTLDPARGSLFNALLFRVFAYFVTSRGDDALDGDEYPLRDGLHLDTAELGAANTDPQTRRYISSENDRVLGTMVAVKSGDALGFLLVESNEDLATAYAGSRLARLFSLLTLVSLMAGGVLFLYATLLSLRIRKLSRQAARAVADDGRIKGFTGSDAHDEIGDLSRHLSSLLSKSAGYTQYLEALSSRLSHELRTPLSVVKTSIENLDREQLDEESRQLLDRASGGADQLGSIIRALVESTRLEQTVQLAQHERVDLDAWMAGCLARYGQIYPHNTFDTGYQRPLNGQIQAAPELLQQAFDKLVDNAVSFADGGPIRLICKLQSTGEQPTVLLAVANQGPAITDQTRGKMFDPMFSDRQSASLVEPSLSTATSSDFHLGLGLYVVRMVAEAHHGRPVVQNKKPWVVVGMQLPVSSPA